MILAAVTISVLRNNGILNKSKDAKFISNMKKYQEETNLYKIDKALDNNDNNIISNFNHGETYNDGANIIVNNVNIKTIIPDLDAQYIDQVVVFNKFFYRYDGTKESYNRAMLCFDHNIPVWGAIDKEDFKEHNKIGTGDTDTPIGEINPNQSTYDATNGYSPDLSGFAPRATYYVKYNNDNSPYIMGRIDRLEINNKNDWYSYPDKKWANVVTVDADEVSYWVWIPRYAYKKNADGTSDIKFITTDNKYKTSNDSETKNLDSGYFVPESFTFGGKDLYGIWVSKYECSTNPNEIIKMTAYEGYSELDTTSHSSEKYTLFKNGELISRNITLPYRTLELDTDTSDICLVSNSTGVVGRRNLKNKIIYERFINVDLSYFKQMDAYYVTYDNNGNPIVGGKVGVDNPPRNWYNYSEKKWANMVTISNNTRTYWVYIPRYVYFYLDGDVKSEVRFVSKKVVNSNGAYKLPDAFTFNNIQLDGVWIMKYEATNVMDNSFSKASKYVNENEIHVDISGFNKNETYYVTYDQNGNEIRTSLNNKAPSGWYDYANKKWANVVTVANGTTTYWTYIPRYAYIYVAGEGSMPEIRFISKDVTSLTGAYKIPDAFTFNGQQLWGIWINKYESTQSANTN